MALHFILLFQHLKLATALLPGKLQVVPAVAAGAAAAVSSGLFRPWWVGYKAQVNK